MNKQVIKLGSVACFAFIIMMGGFAYALKGQDANQNTNQNTNRSGGNQNRNANTGGTNANMNANMNAGGNMNGGNANMDGGAASARGAAGAGGATTLSSTDRNFFMQAAMSGMKEVELSRLAATRATSDDLRAFAQRMVDEHTAKNAELMQLATAKGVTLPAAPDAKLQAMLTRMGALSGAQFDRAYLKEAGVKEHRNAAKLFERASTRATDADVRSFAASTLPAIRMHLSMAEGMNGTRGANHSGMHGNTGGNSNANANTNGAGNTNRSGGNMNRSGGNANRSGGGNTNNSGTGNSNQPFRR